MTLQVITTVDHSTLGVNLTNPDISRTTSDVSNNTITFTYTDPDFRTGIVDNLNNISSNVATLVYSEPGGGTASSGQNVTMNFLPTTTTRSSPRTTAVTGRDPGGSGPAPGSGPFGGTTQIACQIDGMSLVG